ncbi:MAG: hypothetical protein KKE17_09835 [Proteobacteria bacterium]|nr:hypothetical protein [Pseudomonadota bacterium]MBU1710292.1 hypothetical protein [Pseudomonadota bacterium]
MPDSLTRIIKRNCDISDARDNGIYSICILVLKLRNLYKWEKGLEPWEEPESHAVLDWIDTRESCWKTLLGDDYARLSVNGKALDPFDIRSVNESLSKGKQLYGAGYGRSLKAVFFLAEILEERRVEDYQVFILGHEEARELASPFAMSQDGVIYLRRESLRFFFWDHLQEARPSAKAAIQHALKLYGVLDRDDHLDRDSLKNTFDYLVDEEMEPLIYHEIGEIKEKEVSGDISRRLIRDYPDSLIEFFSRALKDVLADTHEKGMLSYILRTRKETSLAFYISFLSGIRRMLAPELLDAFDHFLIDRNWDRIEEARSVSRENNLIRARKLAEIVGNSDAPGEITRQKIEQELLAPLGLMH